VLAVQQQLLLEAFEPEVPGRDSRVRAGALGHDIGHQPGVVVRRDVVASGVAGRQAWIGEFRQAVVELFDGSGDVGVVGVVGVVSGSANSGLAWSLLPIRM